MTSQMVYLVCRRCNMNPAYYNLKTGLCNNCQKEWEEYQKEAFDKFIKNRYNNPAYFFPYEDKR